jgi:putative ABC transport system permease protein
MILTRTLLMFYRKHPLQALFLLTGIIVANVLLVGTLLINAQARASYAQGEQYLSDVPLGQIRHADNSLTIDANEYVSLRRQGFDMLVPLLREFVLTENGQTLEISGIDVFALPRAGQTLNFNPQQSTDNNILDFAFPPYQIWAAAARLEQLGVKTGEQMLLPSGEKLPPILAVSGQQLGHRLLLNLRALQKLTGNDNKISSILVFPSSAGRLEELKKTLPDHLLYVGNDETPNPAELTRSFHLNLAAMGLLAFVVGVFLIYNAVAFSYTDRRDLIRKLRLAGVYKSELLRALLFELSLFLIVGIMIGSWLGAQLSAWLLPGVGRTLAQLYGVYISYPDTLVPSGIWLPILMTILAAVLCAFYPLREALNTPLLERRQLGWQMEVVIRRDRMLAVTGLLLLCAALVIGWSAQHLWLALTGMACLLLGAALLLPAVLRFLINFVQKFVSPQKARLSWLLADSRWLLGPASLALMAMTLALVANSGLNTMIHSFRGATDDWLSQRLVADLYVRGQIDVGEFRSWLETEMPALELAERYRETMTQSVPSGKREIVEIVSLREGDRFRDSVKLIRSTSNATTRFVNGEGIYISERAWRLDGWQPGDIVSLCDNNTSIKILGVYRDYGNPRSQWMLNRQLFQSCWPDNAAIGLSVYGPESSDWEKVKLVISDKFELQDDQIINQKELKKIGMAVFDRTFTITHSLNALTLLVAAIGIFCAISAIHHHRVAQQALLSSLGLTRRERGALLLLQWGMLALLCMVLAWPFGTALAAYLGIVVTPVAFGWSFPLQIEWTHYLVLAALASVCLVLAVLLPSLRLLRTSPAAMLREQNL